MLAPALSGQLAQLGHGLVRRECYVSRRRWHEDANPQRCRAARADGRNFSQRLLARHAATGDFFRHRRPSSDEPMAGLLAAVETPRARELHSHQEDALRLAPDGSPGAVSPIW